VNDKQLKGIPVISVADAEQLGTVERAYLDPESRQIVGFSFHQSGGFLQPESAPLVDTSDIQSFGPDVLTLANPAMIRGKDTAARYADLMDVDRLHGRQVFTEDGQELGKIDSIEFDEHSYRLTGFELGTGFFDNPQPVLVDDIVTIGAEVIVVRNTVVERRHEAIPDAPTTSLDAQGDHETTGAFEEQTIELPISGEKMEITHAIEEREEVAITKEAVERHERITEAVQHEEVHFNPDMDADAAREQDREKGKRRP
jgi:uncharacterized protein YrrD